MTYQTIRNLFAGASALGIVMTGGIAQAQEVTLRAVSAFVSGTTVAKPFFDFVEKVNAEGKGIVQIDLIGGPEAMPPFEVGNAVSNGVVHMAFVPGAFHTNLIPLADSLKLTEKDTAEMRANGAIDFLDQLYQSQMNVKYLARTGIGIPFHIYLTKPIDKPSLEGLRIRTTSVYRAMINALGGTPVQTAPGEVYTALERGAVDGYGWPSQGILDLGWHDHTKYRVDPAFYQVDVSILVNLDSWTGMTDEQRAFLEKMALWVEERNALNAEINAEEYAKQEAAGIEVIRFEGADAEAWLGAAYDAGWAEAEGHSGELARQFRALVSDR